ncbi:MAG: hypothetical protein KGL39_26435 [Patescibacteria group bacterium]|nr:hypothetical protein [Patescibacteria group bacterium]
MNKNHGLSVKIKRLSELGRKKANVRWKKDRERRDKFAALTAEKYPSRIARRIIVIDDESRVKEVVIWNFESARSVRRKERKALSGPISLIQF